MSRPSSSSHYRHRSHPAYASRGRRNGAPVQAAASYTFAHRGHQLRFGPIAFWVIVGTLVIMALWSIITATYFAFRDDVLTGLIARQAEMQHGYEDRIAELRAQIDRISSRQLLDQEQYEQKLDNILRRQVALESRANTLTGLSDVTGSGRPRASSPKPAPIGDKEAAILAPPELILDPHARLFAKGAGGIGGMIIRLHSSLDRVEQRQLATLTSIEDNYDARARRIRSILADLGVDAVKAPVAGMGGPLVPAQLGPDAFDRQLQRIHAARGQINRLMRTINSVPVRKPLDGDIDLTSGFGVRSDPFTGSPALHTGLDLQGDNGDPVRAAADGLVRAAGWSGGYGRVVEIDHGHGLTTRYAHLSSIEVRVGRAVKGGQVVGKVGSSGRSTGPHLHYETRIRGEAVDPHKFLRAGQRLQGSL